MKIAFVTFDFPPFICSTGSGVYAEHVVRELAHLDHEVFVYAPKNNDQSIENSDANANVNWVALNKNFPFKALQFWTRLPKVVAKNQNSSDFDIIHFNGLCYWFLQKKLLDIPHVMTVHHLVKDAKKSIQTYRRFFDVNLHTENAFILPYIERRALESIDRMIAVTNYTKERIIKNYSVTSRKIDVIYNGTELDHIDELQSMKTRVKQDYNLPAKPIVLFVGRIDDPRKGFDVLLKAFKIVSERCDAILVAAGSGSVKKAQQLASKLDIDSRIIFTGFVPDNVLGTFYSICNVYVCVSKLEGFGLTILEAMAAAKPVVATRVAAIPELVNQGINGILVEPEDISGLAEGICRLLEDPTTSTEIGRNNQKYAMQFSWRKNAERIERVYFSLVEERIKDSTAA